MARRGAVRGARTLTAFLAARSASPGRPKEASHAHRLAGFTSTQARRQRAKFAVAPCRAWSASAHTRSATAPSGSAGPKTAASAATATAA